MICAALRASVISTAHGAVIIYQTCGLDKKQKSTTREVQITLIGVDIIRSQSGISSISQKLYNIKSQIIHAKAW